MTTNQLRLVTLLATIFIFGHFNTSSAQATFSHSVAAGLILDQDVIAPVFIYSPRINVAQLGEGASFSVGCNPALSATGDIFIIQFPVMIGLNLGLNSTPDNYSAIGAFIGVGAGFSANSEAYAGEEFRTGQFLHLGVNFSEEWGIRLTFFNELIDPQPGSLTLSVQYLLQ
jgi:hypothetical protein